MTDRSLCGWRVRCDIPLPDLLPWTEGDREVELTIGIGPAPRLSRGRSFESPILQVAQDGSCRYEVPGVATYLVRGGNSIVIDPVTDLTSPAVRVFLLGSVFGIVCHQRGLIPLHASCVDVGGVAIAIAGPSGFGKSTLASAFVGEGHFMLSDDVTVIDQTDPTRTMALPTFPRLQLSAASLEAARQSNGDDALEQSGYGQDKISIRTEEAFQTKPLPLGGIYHLALAGPAEKTRIAPIPLKSAVGHVYESVYRRNVAEHLGKARALFANVARLVSALGETYTLVCPRRIDCLAETVDRITTRHRRAERTGP